MKYKCLVNYLVGFIVVFVLLVEDAGSRPALHGLPLLRAIQDIVNKQTPTKNTRDTAVCTNENQDIMPKLQLVRELLRSDIEYEKLQRKTNANIQKIPKKYFYFNVGVKPKYKKFLKLRKYHNKKIVLGKEEAESAKKHNKHEYDLLEAHTSPADYIHNANSVTTTDHDQITRKTIGKKAFTPDQPSIGPRTETSSRNIAKSYRDTESAQTSEVVETATCPLSTTTIAEEISTSTHRPKTEDNTWSTNESSNSLSQTSTATNEQSAPTTETSTSSITTYKQEDETFTEFQFGKSPTEKSSESETTVGQIIVNENTKITDFITTGSITTKTGFTHNQTDNKHSQIYSTSTLRTGGNSNRHFPSSSTPPDSDHSTNIPSDGRDFEVDTEFGQNGSVLFEVPEDTGSFTHWCKACSKSANSTDGTGVRYGDGGLSNSGTEIADELTRPAKLERDIGNQTEKFFEGEKFFDTGYGNIVVEAITLPEPLQSHGNLRKGVFGIPQRDAGSKRLADRSSKPAQEHHDTEPSQIYT